MGWTQEPSSRTQVVSRHARREVSSNGTTREAIATHQSGNENWFLFHVRTPEGIRSRYIEVMVWEDGWHKEMGEECGPYYYGCPVHWFQQVPCPGGLAANWRTKVIDKHAQQAAEQGNQLQSLRRAVQNSAAVTK